MAIAVSPRATTPSRATLTIDEAVRRFRADPACAGMVRDSYFGRDVQDSARRFQASAEFQEVLGLVASVVEGGTVVDLGAGTGIASAGFLRAGARRAIAIEPDPSDEVGQGAIRRLGLGERLQIVSAFGEDIPLPDGVADLVYCRQVLHHTHDLERTMRECHRILRPGGLFLATREHVVSDDGQLRAFLADHRMHRLAGGENAYRLEQYEQALVLAGFDVRAVFGPWDLVTNAFPHARSAEELERLPAKLLSDRFGAVGRVAARVPGVTPLVWRAIRIERPGRLYSFLARKR